MNQTNLKHVVIAGGTGLVGAHLALALKESGTRVTVLTRNPSHAAHALGIEVAAWADAALAMEGADAVINLAGEGIADRRWSRSRKQALLTSRTEATTRLVTALATCTTKPPVLVNASAVGIYGSCDAILVDERSPLGTTFLAGVCRAWEQAADAALDLGIRLVKLRIGVVLAREGGALPKMALPVRWFQGAALGDGKQGMSWIHIDDLVALLLEVAQNDAYVGPVNATAPLPVSNAAFTRHLGKALHRPILPIPAFLTRAAVRVLVGEMADEMLLSGAFVHPRRASELGFVFQYPDLGAALENLLRTHPRGSELVARSYF